MTTITLPSRCDRAAAEALLPELIAAMGSGAMEIDASGATHVGQAMLQLLVSAKRTFDGAIIRPSAELREIAALAGIDRLLFEGDCP